MDHMPIIAGRMILNSVIKNDAHNTAAELLPMRVKKNTLAPSLIPMPAGVKGKRDMTKYDASYAIKPSI